MQWWEILLLVLVIVVAILAVLYFVGRKLQKKQDEAQQTMDKMKQSVEAFIIEKAKKKMEEANFPKAAIDQVPWYLKGRKWPMAKCKVGPQIIWLIVDGPVYKTLPTNKSVRIEISGAYITGYSTGKKGAKQPVDAKTRAKEKKAKEKEAKALEKAKANTLKEAKKVK